MTRKNWISQPDGLKLFSRYCAPTAWAAYRGISREAAAAELAAVPGLVHPRAVGGVRTCYWEAFLKNQGATVDRWVKVEHTPDELERHYDAVERWQRGERKTEPKLPTGRPTVTRWLQQNPTAEAILCVDGHTLFVRNGEVVGDTLRTQSKRRRVETAAVFSR